MLTMDIKDESEDGVEREDWVKNIGKEKKLGKNGMEMTGVHCLHVVSSSVVILTAGCESNEINKNLVVLH